MATVKRRTDARPKPWDVRWRDESGAQRKRSFARKADADRFRAEVEHSLNVGTYVDPVAGKQTFHDYAERWREAQPHRHNTATRTRSQLNVHVYPVIGSRPISALRQTELQALVTGLRLAPSSVRPVWATVRAILGAAVRDRVIGRNPSEGVKLPELPINEVVPLTLDQVDALAAGVPPRFRSLVETDAGTGLRQGEIFGLEVSHIDFLRRELRVEQQVQPSPGGEVIVCPVKNRHSRRPVPLGQTVVDGIAAHLAAFPAREVEVLDETGRRPLRRLARFAFAYPSGKPLHRNDFNDSIWRPARDAAALPEVTQHDLRHHYASVLIRAGLSPKVVANLLGHANPTVTMRVYAHLWADDYSRARQAIDDAFRRDVPHLRPAKEA